jgi:flagellar protein FlaG
MHPQGSPPTVQVQSTADYRDNYANSVQVRASLWDFFLLFGTALQASPEEVNVRNFQGIYLSPQQAKALSNVLAQNISQYESTFGEISLQPQTAEPTVLQ